MLDPYIFGPNRKLQKDSRIVKGEQNAQDKGRHARQPVARNPLTLRLGMLLIRMGRELTREGIIQEGAEEPSYPVGQVKTRRARP